MRFLRLLSVGLLLGVVVLTVTLPLWFRRLVPVAPVPPPPGMPGWAADAFQTADEADLLALDPSGAGAGPGGFHGWRVLGSVRLDAADRRAVADALIRDGGGGGGYMCFDPRHGVRLTGPAGPVDLVVCFECGNVVVYGPGGKTGYATGSTAQPLLDRLLTAAGVRLAAGPANPHPAR